MMDKQQIIKHLQEQGMEVSEQDPVITLVLANNMVIDQTLEKAKALLSDGQREQVTILLEANKIPESLQEALNITSAKLTETKIQIEEVNKKLVEQNAAMKDLTGRAQEAIKKMNSSAVQNVWPLYVVSVLTGAAVTASAMYLILV